MGIFSQNSGFVKFVNRAIDVLYLNFLWLVFCLPIVTIGASTCAAYYVALKMVDEEEGYIGKTFIKGFKDNFKQGTIFWLLDAPFIYGLFLLWQMVIKGDDINFVIILGVILLTAVITVVTIYTFPLIARYKNSLFNIIRNSFGVAMLYFFQTIFLVLLLAFEIFLIFWNHWTIFVGILIGPICLIYTIAGISKRMFQKIENHEVENSGTINQ